MSPASVESSDSVHEVLLPQVQVISDVEEDDNFINLDPSHHHSHQSLPEDLLFDQYISEGWSGSFFEYSNGSSEMSFEEGEWVLVAKRNDEVSWNDLSPEEVPLFQKSDKLEWESIVATGAVKVHYGEHARRLRKQYAHRCITSRMVRRRKPQPGVGNWKVSTGIRTRTWVP